MIGLRRPESLGVRHPEMLLTLDTRPRLPQAAPASSGTIFARHADRFFPAMVAAALGDGGEGGAESTTGAPGYAYCGYDLDLSHLSIAIEQVSLQVVPRPFLIHCWRHAPRRLPSYVSVC